MSGTFRNFKIDVCVTQSHKKLHKAVREFVDNIVYPDAQERELDGKRPSQSVLDKMAYVDLSIVLTEAY